MVELERRGIPTVLFTAQTFVHDAHRSAASFGLAGLPLAVVPLPFTNQTPRDIQGMAEQAFDQVQAGLTRPVEAPQAVERPPLDERLRYDGDDLLDACGRMQTDFLARGWSDGFPLVPPTERAVAALLRSTRRGPADPIATLEPGFGIATVEKLAINAVMAGCGPEHLALLIAAVRCLAEPKMYIRNKAMSTGPHAPLVLVNGPKGRAANLNSGVCALGPGAPSASNTVLGRAVRLTMMNVGHTYVGVSDMDTIGSPLKYSLCCAENEAESPWEPYHVTRGFAPDASTITVHFVYGICELHDFRSTTPEDLDQVLGRRGPEIVQLTDAVDEVHGDRGRVRREASRDVIRLPRALGLVLRAAEAVLERRADRVHVRHADVGVADVHHGEPHRPAQDGVARRRRPGAERAHARVQAGRPPLWPVAEHEGCMGARGHGLVTDVHLRLREAADRRDQERKVLGTATRHHRVDRELLDGRDAEARLERRDHVGRAATGRPEQRGHGALGRGYERKPVGPATRE